VLALLLASSTERICYAAVAVFMPTFLLTRFGLTPPELAASLALVATGNLAGNVLGAQLSDRVPMPQAILATSLIGAGLLAVPVFTLSEALPVAIVLSFAYTTVNAMGRPAGLTALSRVSNEARGAVLGLNVTFSSLGWIGATALGGLAVGVGGFGGLAIVTLGFGALGGALALATWLVPRERRRLVMARGER
jgi:predicted MFS family arabinose efflux permease